MKRKVDLEKLKLLYAQDLQLWKIAEIFGCCRSAVDRSAKKLGLRKDRTGPKSGERHTGWKGGKVIRKGYLYIYQPDHSRATKAGYVLEHRLIMERKLGRLLDRKEVVHHVDGNRLHNVPTNLVAYRTNAQHLVGHLAGNREHGKRISEGMQKSARWKRIRRHLKSKRDVR